jgi:hypothetical protein
LNGWVFAALVFVVEAIAIWLVPPLFLIFVIPPAPLAGLFILVGLPATAFFLVRLWMRGRPSAASQARYLNAESDKPPLAFSIVLFHADAPLLFAASCSCR